MNTLRRVDSELSRFRPAASRGWLSFFLAAMSAGSAVAQEQSVLDYWWVMPEAAPANAPRVIRVIGEKGENYEEVYAAEQAAALRNSPAIMEARLARQEMLRREAMELVQQGRALGKTAAVAYEEAWAQVYSRHWLNSAESSCKLEDMLARLAAEDKDYALSEEEQQWVLEALLEDDDRLDTEAGRELLRRLARRLRELGYGRLYSPTAVNDQLMQRFADALAQGMHSMAAYRDALFKTHRNRIMRHSLHTYPAPWGLKGGLRYHQAPPPEPLPTEGSGNSQPAPPPALPAVQLTFAAPGLNAVPGAPADFRATAPAAGEKEEEQQSQEENEEEEQALVQQAPAASTAPPAARGMLRSFSVMRAAAAPAAEELPENAVTSGTNTSFHVNTAVNGHNQDYGNRYGAEWGSKSKSETTSGWLGTVTATITFNAWGGGTEMGGTPTEFVLAGGNLYLGNGYSGNISVTGSGSVLHAESLEHKSATERGSFLNLVSATVHAVYQVPGSGEFRYGTLSGSGDLTLSNNAAAENAVIYIFNDGNGRSWFDGSVKFGASRGGIVELDLAADAAGSQAWSETVFDMSGTGVPTAGYGISGAIAPARTILNIRGDVTISGLSGGSENSTVTSESGDLSYTLTLGNDSTDYTYGGTFNGSYYTSATREQTSPASLNLTKQGSNTQQITQSVTGNRAFNVITVAGGTLDFDGDVEAAKLHAEAGVLSARNLTLTGGEDSGSSMAALQITGGRVEVSGDVSAYNANVLGSTGYLSAENLHVNHKLSVTGSRVEIGDTLSAVNVYVADGGRITTEQLTATGDVEIGMGAEGAAEAYLTSTAHLETPVLRLRSNGRLVTGGSVSVSDELFLHGGGSWSLSGTGNVLGASATMHFEETADNPVVFTSAEGATLTLPGTLGMYRSGWDGETPFLSLDSVTLDFSRGVTITNTGLALGEDSVLILASIAGNAGYTGTSVTVMSGDARAWHALLGTSTDAQHIILTIQHELIKPYEVGAGSLVYIEMYQDAAHPALPYKAFSEAKYSTGTWSGKEVAASDLYHFNHLKIAGGGRVYMGEDQQQNTGLRAHRHFGGNIDIAPGESGAAAELHGQLGEWGNWLLDGHLSGTGELKLVAHHTNTGEVSSGTSTRNDEDGRKTTVTTTAYGVAGTFTFTNVENPDGWFSGTLSLADPAGGIVQLNVGNVNIAGRGDTRWDEVVIDLTRSSFRDHQDASGKTGTAAELVLGVMGNATLAGLKGDADSSVVAHASQSHPVLTLGEMGASSYDFGGTIGGSGRFYTGGQAYRQDTVTQYTTQGTGNQQITQEVTSTDYVNFIPTVQGALNLNKTGTNSQSFSGSAYLNRVQVLAGTLAFTGTADIQELAVHSGATLRTGNDVDIHSLTLYGDSTWELSAGTDRYLQPLYLVDMAAGGVNVDSVDGTVTWAPSRYMNLSGAGLSLVGENTFTAGGDALFMLGGGVSLDLSSPHVLTNVAGVTENSWIALYGNVSDEYELHDDMVLVEDTDGRFYDANYYQHGSTIYLQLGSERAYGIEVTPPGTDDGPEHAIKGYVWSGVPNGTTDPDVNHISLTMGNVWRADGNAVNTGWHEQRADGSGNDDIGIYVNGHSVYFADNNVHYYVDEEKDTAAGAYATERKVDIKGTVAPGHIYVLAENNAGRNGSSEAQMEFGYAFVSTDGTGTIADFSPDLPTSITKTGDALLIINTSNTFTGGIDVQDGGLYLAAVGAAGSGTLTFHTDRSWSYKVVGNNTSAGPVYEMERTGAELMICYPHSDEAVSGFRGSSLANDIVLTADSGSGDVDVAGRFKVSFAHASFNEKSSGDDHANVPRHWRSLTLSGALVGAGYVDAEGKWVNTSRNDTIELTGYCSTWPNVRDQSYVSSITLSEDTVHDSYRTENGEIVNRFAGTVCMLNTVNTSPLDSNELSKRIAGTVQLVLKGDKLSEAELNMTRESVVQEAWDGKGANPRQTYNNILVINDDATLRGLSAAFVGSGYYFHEYNTNDGSVNLDFHESVAQRSEVWHVRTVTNGLNTLYLGEWGDVDDTTYVYSGAMGFAQAYAGTSQAHVPWGDGFMLHNVDWYFGTHSMGTATLSLTKSASSAQYIHTALLQDVSVYEGTLGFNNLELQGNLNLVGGSRLRLGVDGEHGWNAAYGSLSEEHEKRDTKSSISVQSGKTLTVITLGAQDELRNEVAVPEVARVDGNLELQTGSSLSFRIQNVLPYSVSTTQTTASQGSSIVPLLDIAGTLTLPAQGNGVAVTLTGVDFSTTSFQNKRFYLAAADEMKVGAGNETTYTPRTITLGYGYFGTLYMVGNAGSSLAGDTDISGRRDYLVMTVNGDPRRTWSGMMCEANQNLDHITAGNYTWDATTTTPESGFDYRWKENLPFRNGQVVLFGNLYQPVKWKADSADLSSADTVNVMSPLHAGTLVQNTEEADSYEFEIDDYSVENFTGAAAFQAVKVQGEVAPFSIIINSDYWLYENEETTPALSTGDSTNYYFYSVGEGENSGSIRDASEKELKELGFDTGWKTMLHKSGEGVVVMALDNRYTGGSVLQGGRLVMQHVNALGYVYNGDSYTGNECSITLMNGAGLHGDFADSDFPGNYVEDGNVALGKAMETTTIRNKVVVNVYADPTDPDYDTLVDARLFNSSDKKLILARLEGEADTVLELNGVGRTEGDKYHYGVFKVLDPGKFYGTVTMNGHVWGKALDAAGGMVQLDIMSTAKSAEGADWLNATVDLSVKEGTERTVVALDVMSSGEICVLNSITGTIETENGSSSVLNMSRHNAATLQLTGTRNGDYDGVLGYGDFQVAVNYGGYSEAQQGTTQHHYGAIGHGSLNLIKQGEGSTQHVRRAWLNSLEVQGGVFHVKEALVAHDIAAGRGKRVMVGAADDASLYALTVGAGGTLAMNTTFAESGVKQDAWEKLEGGTTQGDTTTWVAWVLLEDGATLSAREDWYTARQVDIATDAAVTINTHNFAIDPYINKENDPFGKYGHSHIIQLLGKLTGRNVTLNINNILTDPDKGDALRTDAESEFMGYVAINDHNDFIGSNRVNVGAMTVLQLLGSNDSVEADVDMTVSGRHATVQVVDNRKQYVDHLVLGAAAPVQTEGAAAALPQQRVNNGQLMLGGQEVTTLVPDQVNYRRTPDTAGLQILISARRDSTELQTDAGVTQEAGTMEASLSHLHLDLSGAAVKMGGEDEHVSVAANALVDVVDKAATHVMHDIDFHYSLIQLQEDCSVNLADAVLIDYQSAVKGVNVDPEAVTVAPTAGPVAATGSNSTSWTKEVTTAEETTVQLTFGDSKGVYRVGSADILVLQTDQFQGVDVTGTGLTIQLHEDMNALALSESADYVALMISGGSGRFLYEQDHANFANLLDSEFVLQDRDGNNIAGYWVTSVTVQQETGASAVSMHMLYFRVTPEPSTTTLSLLALAALMSRRRRK